MAMDGATPGQEAAADEAQVTLQFITKLPAEFRVPETPVTVPATLTRYGLSQIINHLLGLDPSRPFDFLVHGELLRLSLHKHLLAKQLSTEAVLHVEYVPAVLPPTPKEQHPHDDWVSAIAPLHLAPAAAHGTGGTLPLVIATGCYDGAIRMWRGGECVSSFPAHKGTVKAAAAVGTLSGAMLITGGDDCTARVWQWQQHSVAAVAAADAAPPAPELAALLKGHSAAVEALAASPSSDRCATAGWDSKLLLWRCGRALTAAIDAGGEDEEQPAAGRAASRKKRKAAAATAAGGSAAVPSAAHEERPMGSLTGHTQCVSAVAWPAEHVVASASWDHSVRLWDPETGGNTETLSHNKAVHCLAAAPGGGGGGGAITVAFGGAERVVRVWDARVARGDVLSLRALSSHADWVSAVAWHPTSPHYLLSASYDKTAKLWDLRAAIPLHTLPAAGDKLLACAWLGAGEVAYGGADCTLRTASVGIA